MWGGASHICLLEVNKLLQNQQAEEAVQLSEPREEQITIVIVGKKRIVELTGKILDTIYESKSRESLGEEQELSIKKLVNEIISELSTIAGFCGSRERDIISSMARLIPAITFQTESTTMLLEEWCTIVNGISVDFNRMPFRFYTGELNTRWGRLEGRIKALLGR